MQTSDDVNNSRIRELIEQFNSDEACETERRAALSELDQIMSENATLSDLIAALRVARWKLPEPSPDAIGVCVETSSPGR